MSAVAEAKAAGFLSLQHFLQGKGRFRRDTNISKDEDFVLNQ